MLEKTMGMRKVTIITYDCPSCGASVKIDSTATKATCEYCGNQFVIEQENTQKSNVPPTNGGYRADVNARARKIAIIIPIVIISVFFMGTFIFTMLAGVLMEVDSMKKDSTFETEIKEIDPFKDIKVTIEGKEPWAEVSMISSNDSNVSGVSYDVDKKSGLSNGDVITITVDEPSRGTKWTKTSFEYTVSGLDTIVTDISQISESDKEMLFQEARKEIDKDWKEHLDYVNMTAEDINLDIQEYDVYLALNKEKEITFYSDFNKVCPTYIATFEGNGKTLTYYLYVSISNVYYSADGTIHGDFDSTSGSNGFEFCDAVSELFVVNGFDSQVKMESNMEDENFVLVK